MTRAALALLLALALTPARAAEGLRAVDGDTLEVLATRERIRVLGVDTPELFSPKCRDEAALAEAARDFTAAAIAAAGTVYLNTEGTDRYGRTLARIYVDGVDLADALIAAGLGRAYAGGRRRGWC